MQKPTKTPKETALSDFLKSALGVTTIASLAVIAAAAWYQIRATMNWQPGMEYMFMLFAPFVLSAAAVLLINGIILIVRAVRRRYFKKGYRIAMAIAGLVLLSPASYFAYGYFSYEYIKYNAERISSNEEVAQLVRECKIKTIRREHVSRIDAKAFLKDSAKSHAEKDSYFYGHRTFDPDYYDELAKIAQSDDVLSACGPVELYDERREDIPITYNWASKTEALEALDACKIRDVYLIMDVPQDKLKQSTNVQNESNNIFMILDPIAQGFSGTLYLVNSDQATRTEVLEFAKTKKGNCMYKQPNIDGLE